MPTSRETFRVGHALEALPKVLSMVQSGETVAIGGYFNHRHPMSAVRELIRQGKRGLHLVTPLGGFDAELLMTGEVADTLTFAFVGLDAFGQSPGFRRAIESGRVKAIEYGDVTLARALEASARTQKWYPARTWIGSDIEPYHPGESYVAEDGEHLWRAPALDVDWAIVHAPFSTAGGEVAIPGESFDSFLLKAATNTIIIADKIISEREMVEEWNGRIIARPHCNYVLEIPLGAHPTSCYPHYVQDVLYLTDYLESRGDVGRKQAFVGESEIEYQNSLDDRRRNALRGRMELALRVADIYR